MEALASVYNYTLGVSPLAQLIQVVFLVLITYTVLVAGKSFMDAVTIR